jgi:DNA ligase-associated metallophosphoesterase
MSDERSDERSHARVEIAGESLLLFAERVAYWERARTLLVADPHWGKAATFRSEGIPVPHGTTADGLARLDATLARVGARRVVYLGDFLHARGGRSPATLGAVASWRARHAGVGMLIVRGNHDVHAGDAPPELGIPSLDGPLVEPPFVLVHRPAPNESGYVLAGHLHPGAELLGAGRQRERLPCFWFGERVGVLPAFGDFTGLWSIQPRTGDRVFVVAGDEVVER